VDEHFLIFATFTAHRHCARCMRNHAKIWAALSMAFWIGSSASAFIASKKDAEYRTRECAFRYPGGCKLSVAQHGAVIRLALPSRSQYWQDAVAIRKLNKETEQCDIPQNAQPDSRDRRKIAGLRAYAYSGEDAAMNRYVKTKGYMIERAGFCWDFQLVQTGKPYRKFDLPEKELKRLGDQAERDAKAAQTAFNTVLDSFDFVRAK
jgi:hypothetical protein